MTTRWRTDIEWTPEMLAWRALADAREESLKQPPVSDALKLAVKTKADACWTAFYAELSRDSHLTVTHPALFSEMFYGLQISNVMRSLNKAIKVTKMEKVDRLIYGFSDMLHSVRARQDAGKGIIHEDIHDFFSNRMTTRVEKAYNGPSCSGGYFGEGFLGLTTFYNIMFAAETEHESWFEDAHIESLEKTLETYPLTEMATKLAKFLRKHDPKFAGRKP